MVIYIYNFSYFGRTHKRYGFDVWMITDGFYYFRISVHHIKNAVGQSRGQSDRADNQPAG